MCTVSVVPHEDGYRVMCNRDERLTRPSARPPRPCKLGARTAVYPSDQQGGGTWIGVNDAGVAVALLNRAPSGRMVTRRPQYSRGLIVPPLLEFDALATAAAAAARLDPAAFEPFSIVLVQGDTVCSITSDGSSLATERAVLRVPVLFTSSSLGDSVVGPPRRRLFTRMVTAAPSWLDGQRRFHSHAWRGRPAVSVCMTRRDAKTVSRSPMLIRLPRMTRVFHDLSESTVVL